MAANRYSPEQLPVVIFCGGRGTRLKEETEIVPKPLVRIGERPILWHIMKIYFAQGFKKFVLLGGYKCELIKDYFYNYPVQMSDFTVRYENGVRQVSFHRQPDEDWEVTVLDTGLMAETGARLRRARRFLENGPFMLTYGDGVSNVDLHKLIEYHEHYRPLVTLTGVHPPGRFGEIRTDGVYATSFWEKPNVAEGYINGGFMLVEPETLGYIGDDELLSFEKHILPKVAADKRMTVLPHDGYWQCMDTLRDTELLNSIWKEGEAPWKLWGESAAIAEAKISWQDVPVLVTGGAGFIGSHLAHALVERGARVTILDIQPSLPELAGHYRDLSSRVKYVCGDVADEALLQALIREGSFGAVFHLAAEAIVARFHTDPAQGLKSNVQGTWALLEAIRSWAPQTPIVIASSDKAYGSHDKLPYDEQSPLQGRNPYDCSKSCADLVTNMYAHAYGLRTIVTRCGNVYGGGDLNFSRIIPDVIQSVLRGQAPVIRSDGQFKRDYVYVDDIVAAYLSCAEALRREPEAYKGETFNFGPNEPLKVIEVVERILSQMDARHLQPIIQNQVKYEIKEQSLDAAKAMRRLGWRAQVSFDEGLRRAIEWYRNYADQ